MNHLNMTVLGALVGLARAAEGNEDMLTPDCHKLIFDCLLASETETEELLNRIDNEKRRLIPSCFGCAAPCGKNSSYDMAKLDSEAPELKDMKLSILSALQDIAGSGPSDGKVISYILKALYFIGLDSWSAEGLSPLLHEARAILAET